MSSSKTPLVDSLKLPLVHTDAFAIAPGGLYVNIKDLEAVLEKLPKVIRCAHWSEEQWSTQEHIIGGKTGQEFIETHTARLMCIQEIKSEPVKVEFEAIVTSHLAGINAMIKRSELIPFIGKYVHVTVESIDD